MTEALDVAIVWHMHQPYYKISDTGAFEMPWVRTHAVKDYAEMVELLEGYPGLRQTFNLVPSLVEQLSEYASGDYLDTYQEHTDRPADDLTHAEKTFLLRVMCERATHPRARRHPRYLELAQKRDRCVTEGGVRVEEFSEAELRDLQVWFELAWFHPAHMDDGPLADLARRGRGFSEEDKQAIRAARASLIDRIIPTYRRATAAGRIELTTSPYFHPILPLLMNSDLARVSLPEVTLPTRRFDHPEDADEHVRAAMSLHTDVFGEPPRGMWCSEQSVGEDVIPLLSRNGLLWTVSDEAVLARSFGRDLIRDTGGRLTDPAFLYSTYRLEREQGRLDIVFRDRVLSDLVGFTYREWDASDAASDLLRRLRQIHHDLPPDGRAHLITLALDGENAWEYYRNEGRDFLERLYEGLMEEPALRCVTVSEHLEEHPAAGGIPWLHTGSWIGGDLGTWVGDKAHRPAWDLLHDARDAVVKVRARAGDSPQDDDHASHATPSPTPAAVGAPDTEAAWKEILIAEGSDWFWWFSDHQESGLDDIWDAAFRRHLQQAYRLAHLTPPPALFASILGRTSGGPDGRLTPCVDGRLTTPGEWDRGLRLRGAGGGVMRRSETAPVEDLRFGWSGEALYFLVVPRSPLPEGGLEVTFHLGDPETLIGPDAGTTLGSLGFESSHRLSFTLHGTGEGLAVEAPAREGLTVAAGAVIEAAVSWDSLPGGGREGFFVGATASVAGGLVESYPSTGSLVVRP